MRPFVNACSSRSGLGRAAVLAMLWASSGCAGVFAGSGPSAQAVANAGRGWVALAAGDGPAADRAFEEAAPRGQASSTVNEGAALALFGRATLAFERADDARAADATLTLVEAAAAGRAGPAGGALATALLPRLGPLLGGLSQRRAREDRLLAVLPDGLPWAARLALSEVVDSVARRRGDARLLSSQPDREGCLTRVQLLGVAGRLPHEDLDQPFSPAKGDEGRPVEVSGCRLTLPSLEAYAGARVLRASVELTRDVGLLALDFVGTGRVRVDGGPWWTHGSAKVYGPRWSAFPVALGKGSHTIEIRLATFGGAAELRLFALPAAAQGAGEGGAVPSLGDAAATELLAALAADTVGDVDRALDAVASLGKRRSFAVGLAVAGALLARDPTRPGNLGRDASRALWTRAVERDPSLGRLWRELAIAELARNRSVEALEAAERAVAAAPGWPSGVLTLIETLRARGFEVDADRALDSALPAALEGEGACALLQLGQSRAEERHRVEEEDRLAEALARCHAQSTAPIERLRKRGDLAAAEAALDRLMAVSGDRIWLGVERAGVRLARGDAAGAVRDLDASSDLSPRETALRLKLADAWFAAGEQAKARAIVAEAARRSPGRGDVRQAARALGIPLPFDAFRLDGRAVVRAFADSGQSYAAPAVLVLDRTVARVLEDGAQIVLTHNIVKVESKDAIARWGEVQVPEGAEILAVRTHKKDGSVREAEEIVGKASVSAPELASGEFVEWETVEYREPAESFAPGFLGDRFYFRSVELPLDRSEYVVVAPEGLTIEQDRRAGAPEAIVEGGPDGTRVLRFVAKGQPQLFAERAAAPALQWIPSVRVSSGVKAAGWARYLADQLYGVARSSPALREVARTISASVGDRKAELPDAIVRWVTDKIEPEGGFAEPATSTLARGRGNRAGLIVALAEALGVRADLVLARSPVRAPPGAPICAQELDEFDSLLVRFAPVEGSGGPARFVDARLKRAPFGYLHPAVDGALTLAVGSGRLERAQSTLADERKVSLELTLAADGSGEGSAREQLSGLPAIEWGELVERAGGDESKLRKDFEQRWLSHHFPGARLKELAVELQDRGRGGGRLVYTFASPQIAVPAGQGVLKLVPAFFRSEPGMRFATEGERRTELLIPAEVPLELSARIRLPVGARVIDLGGGGTVSAGQAKEIQFGEQRVQEKGSAAAGPSIIVHRQARIQTVRIAPAAYDTVAAPLRRVDALEEAEIRVALP